MCCSAGTSGRSEAARAHLLLIGMHVAHYYSYVSRKNRGSAISSYVGNQRFRDLTKERQADYRRASQNRDKQKIARDVLKLITARGGRFLRLEENSDQAESEIDGREWYEVDKDVKLEKIKQALRENRSKPTKSGKSNGTGNGAFDVLHQAQPSSPLMTMSPVLPSSMLFGTNSFSTIPTDSQLVMLQQLQSALQQQQMAPQSMAVAPAFDPYLNAVRLQSAAAPLGLQQVVPLTQNVPSQVVLQNVQTQAPSLVNSMLYSQLQNSLLTKTDSAAVTHRQANVVPQKRKEVNTTSIAGAPELEPDREDAVIALSALTVANHPKFTEEEEALERATTSDEERAEILSDMFGKYCSVDGDRPGKRPRRDLDEESIDFLVNHMRGEIQKIPEDQKQALLHAQGKCDSEEFSDARLAQFLRCEGMNAKVQQEDIFSQLVLVSIDHKFLTFLYYRCV